MFIEQSQCTGKCAALLC